MGREYWVQLGSSPIVYRYIDWTITVPLQMVEFYLILAAVQPTINAGIFWRLLLGTVAMLVAGYCGEAGFVNAWAGFMVGMAGWAFILFEIVSAGWSIYPLGYFFGYLQGSVKADSLNLIYNVADVINKIAFCLAIWHSAKKDTMEKGESLLA